MAVLLMYNTADSYTYQEINDATKISPEILTQVLENESKKYSLSHWCAVF